MAGLHAERERRAAARLGISGDAARSPVARPGMDGDAANGLVTRPGMDGDAASGSVARPGMDGSAASSSAAHPGMDGSAAISSFPAAAGIIPGVVGVYSGYDLSTTLRSVVSMPPAMAAARSRNDGKALRVESAITFYSDAGHDPLCSIIQNAVEKVDEVLSTVDVVRDTYGSVMSLSCGAVACFLCGYDYQLLQAVCCCL